MKPHIVILTLSLTMASSLTLAVDLECSRDVLIGGTTNLPQSSPMTMSSTPAIIGKLNATQDNFLVTNICIGLTGEGTIEKVDTASVGNHTLITSNSPMNTEYKRTTVDNTDCLPNEYGVRVIRSLLQAGGSSTTTWSQYVTVPAVSVTVSCRTSACNPGTISEHVIAVARLKNEGLIARTERTHVTSKITGTISSTTTLTLPPTVVMTVDSGSTATTIITPEITGAISAEPTVTFKQRNADENDGLTTSIKMNNVAINQAGEAFPWSNIGPITIDVNAAAGTPAGEYQRFLDATINCP